MKELIMLYGEYCLNAKLMIPHIKSLNSKNKFHFDIVKKESGEGKAVMQEYKSLIGRLKDSSPLFIDKDKNKILHAPDAESLMEWLVGKKDWWNY